MFVIPRAQQSELSALEVDRFVRDTCAMLRRALPAYVAHLDDAALDARVRRALGRSLSYGVDDECDAQRFIRYDIGYGEGFEHRVDMGFAREVLLDPTIEPQRRIDVLDARCIEWVAEGARRA